MQLITNILNSFGKTPKQNAQRDSQKNLMYFRTLYDPYNVQLVISEHLLKWGLKLYDKGPSNHRHLIGFIARLGALYSTQFRWIYKGSGG